MAGEPYFSVKRHSLCTLKSRDAVTVMQKVMSSSFFKKGGQLTEPKTIKSRACTVKKQKNKAQG